MKSINAELMPGDSFWRPDHNTGNHPVMQTQRRTELRGVINGTGDSKVKQGQTKIKAGGV